MTPYRIVCTLQSILLSATHLLHDPFFPVSGLVNATTLTSVFKPETWTFHPPEPL
jgi:hypothetical protein